MEYLVVSVATFGGNLTRLRERAGFKTSKSLADALDVVPSVVSKMENDLQGLPEGPTLLRLAKTLRCSVDELLEGIDPEYQSMLERRANEVEPEHLDVSGYTPDDIPVIAEGEASPQGTLFWDDEGKLRTEVERRVSRPRDITDQHAYGVQVRGDSMVPRYFPGELLIVSPRANPRSGMFAYVELLNGERLIKRAHRQQGGWNLESVNAAYAPRFVRDDEIGVIHKIMYSRSL